MEEVSAQQRLRDLRPLPPKKPRSTDDKKNTSTSLASKLFSHQATAESTDAAVTRPEWNEVIYGVHTHSSILIKRRVPHGSLPSGAHKDDAGMFPWVPKNHFLESKPPYLHMPNKSKDHTWGQHNIHTDKLYVSSEKLAEDSSQGDRLVWANGVLSNVNNWENIRLLAPTQAGGHHGALQGFDEISVRTFTHNSHAPRLLAAGDNLCSADSLYSHPRHAFNLDEWKTKLKPLPPRSRQSARLHAADPCPHQAISTFAGSVVEVRVRCWLLLHRTLSTRW